MILGQLVQLVQDASPDGLEQWPWITSIITPAGVAIAAAKLYRDMKGERDKVAAEKDALTKVMIDEWVPLMTRNLDLLKAIEDRMVAPQIKLRERGS